MPPIRNPLMATTRCLIGYRARSTSTSPPPTPFPSTPGESTDPNVLLSSTPRLVPCDLEAVKTPISTTEVQDMMAQLPSDASPQHAGHMASAFHHTQVHHPGHSIPPPHNLPPSGAYHDASAPSKDESLSQPPQADQQHPLSQQPESNGNPGPLTTAPPTKGKNGATGPAAGKLKPHLCQICKRGFTTGGHLQRHQRIHTGVKAFSCPFPGCETRTSRQDNLQQHYRTHLAPTLRRGSGSTARAAVNAAMEAAGLKSSSTRAPRKSKGSAGGTPSSAASVTSRMPSPYQTPTGAQGGPMPPYGAPYMYDPQHGYPPYAMPHPMNMGQPQSANSSRPPSPTNGHSSAHSSVGSMPSGHHPQFFNQIPPSYYPGMQHQQYRYGPGPGVPVPYGGGPPPHHAMYPSPAMFPDQHHFAQMQQNQFPQHSRDSSYGSVLAPGYSQNPMANGYPPRTQTSTPLSQAHEGDDRYRRAPSPRRRTPPGSHDMLAQGVLDPAHMSTNRQPGGMPPAYAGYGAPMGYAYPAPPSMAPHGAPGMSHRASISSMSDNGSGGGSGSAHAQGGSGEQDGKGDYPYA